MTEKKTGHTYTYPALLKARIDMIEAEWDLTHWLNRRELRHLKIRYYLWWKWAPIPAALIGATIGGTIGVAIFWGIAGLFR